MEPVVIGQAGGSPRLVQNDSVRVFKENGPVLAVGSGVQVLIDAGHIKEIDGDNAIRSTVSHSQDIPSGVVDATETVSGASDVSSAGEEGAAVRSAGGNSGLLPSPEG